LVWMVSFHLTAEGVISWSYERAWAVDAFGQGVWAVVRTIAAALDAS